MSTVQSLVRGWCPDLFAPMQAADGLLVRIRPWLGRLSVVQAESVAELAQRFGNGVIELTNRANLQLRGFSPDGAREALRIAISDGLVCADPAHERRRALLISPLAGLDPDCHEQTEACAGLLQDRVLDADDLEALPGKFGFSVDGGGWFPVGALSADIMLRACPAGWKVVLGDVQSQPLAMEAAVAGAVAVARGCITLGCAGGGKVLRPSRNPEAGPQLLQQAGLLVYPCEQTPLFRPPAVGSLPGQVFGLGAVMGRLTAGAFLECARAVQDAGHDGFRVTPWRSLVVPEPIRDMQEFVTDADDARLRIQACIGPTGCRRTEADVGQAALFLAPEVPRGEVLHVSGCIKGCAHPGAASMTLIAQQGDYDVVCHGRTTDRPNWTHQTLVQVKTLLRTELKDFAS